MQAPEIGRGSFQWRAEPVGISGSPAAAPRTGLACGQLCKTVSVIWAAYYKWQNRTFSKKQSDDEELAHLISEIYQSQHGIPGYIDR